MSAAPQKKNKQKNVEPFDLRNFQSRFDYFNYYRRNYGYYSKIKDLRTNFQNLADYMGWNNYSTEEWNNLNKIKNETNKIEKLRNIFKEYEMPEDFDIENYTFEENFDYLSECLGWNSVYPKRKEEFECMLRQVADPFDIEDFSTIQQYFNYFRKNFGFTHGKIRNAKEIFQRSSM